MHEKEKVANDELLEVVDTTIVFIINYTDIGGVGGRRRRFIQCVSYDVHLWQ